MIKNEEDCNKELPGTSFCSNRGPFSYLCNYYDSEDDSGSTEFDIMGKIESNHSTEKIDSKLMTLEAESKSLADENIKQQKLL